MSCPPAAVIARKPFPIRQYRHLYLRRPRLWGRERIDGLPHLHDARPPRREHAVLEAIEILPVDGRHELARQETEQDPRRQVMFPDTLPHLEVLVEHGPEGKWDRLFEEVRYPRWMSSW